MLNTVKTVTASTVECSAHAAFSKHFTCTNIPPPPPPLYCAGDRVSCNPS